MTGQLRILLLRPTVVTSLAVPSTVLKATGSDLSTGPGPRASATWQSARVGRITASRPITRLGGPGPVETRDTLVVEEPLEIRVGGRPLAVTMRTPGDDFDLAAGFLVSEGVISERYQLRSIRYCAGARAEGGNTYNVLDVELAPGVPAPDPVLERSFYTTSSCGLCGKASLEAVRTKARWSVGGDPLRVSVAMLTELSERLRSAQHVFERTGGLHGAALFAPSGDLLCLREDVGRHNAVDKVVGWALREDRLPLGAVLLMVSGRASFELVQKAWMAGIPLLAAVSAPSSRAVDLADEAGRPLGGVLRGSTMNIYAGSQRVLV